MKKQFTFLFSVIVLVSMLLVACQPQAAATSEPTAAMEEATATPVTEVVATAAPAATEAMAEEAPAAASQYKPGELKVALLLDGPINDQGWNQGAYDGLAAIKTKYLADVAYSESVARADMETAFADYAARGYSVVIAHGFEFSDAAEKVAAQYPDTIFLVTHGKSGLSGNNVGTIQFEEEQIGFLLGILAGGMTQSNQIAAIGGQNIPAISIPFQAFELGVQQVNPDAQVTVSWIDSWTDIAKMKEAAKAAIANGADIVFPVASGASPGGLYAAAEAQNVWGIGYSGDQFSFAPDITLSSGIVDTGLAIELVVDKIADGTWEPTDYWFGLKDNVVRMAPYHNTEDKIPQEVKDNVEQWTQKILSGEYEVPLKMEF